MCRRRSWSLRLRILAADHGSWTRATECHLDTPQPVSSTKKEATRDASWNRVWLLVVFSTFLMCFVVVVTQMTFLETVELLVLHDVPGDGGAAGAAGAAFGLR